MGRRWIVAVSMVLLAAGCSTASDPNGVDPLPAGSSPSAGSSAGSSAGLDCPTASAVNSALGTAVGEPNKTVSGIVTVCTYVSAKSGTVLVRFQTKEDAAGFAVGRQGFESSGQKTTDVSGLGDQAFSSTLGGGTIAVTTLVARKGEVEVLVTSRAAVDKETALITTIFAAL